MIVIIPPKPNHALATSAAEAAPRAAHAGRRSLLAATTLALWLVGGCAETEPPANAVDDGALPADTAASESPVGDAPAGAANAGGATIGERAIGTVRLGMSETELRGAHAGARDTTWQAEGMEERGVIVPIGPGDATALLVNGAVARINVRSTALKTYENLGVGATLGQLRAAYGRACAATGEDGRAVVWFAAQPGVSFALDQRPGEQANSIEEDPSLLPDSAVVEELWVHGESIAC